jgi:hypothetical protein
LTVKEKLGKIDDEIFRLWEEIDGLKRKNDFDPP